MRLGSVGITGTPKSFNAPTLKFGAELVCHLIDRHTAALRLSVDVVLVKCDGEAKQDRHALFFQDDSNARRSATSNTMRLIPGILIGFRSPRTMS